MNIIKLSAIDSTNTYLKLLCRETHVEDGLIVVAENQTNGRGQVGASWQSTAGKDLTFSLFKKFNSLLVSQQSSVLFTTALALKEALENLSIPDIEIKWPNDILAGGKKCCGILIENQLQQDKISSVIVGVGLNVNETKFKDLRQATSLQQTTGKYYDLDLVLREVSETLLKQLGKMETFSSEEIKKRYEASLFRKDQVSSFERPNGNNFSGVIRGVTEAGELIVEKAGVTLETFEVKQVKLVF